MLGFGEFLEVPLKERKSVAFCNFSVTIHFLGFKRYNQRIQSHITKAITMCHLHHLDIVQKTALRDQLLIYANAMGGKNSFLKLLETIRHSSPNALISKTANIRFSNLIVTKSDYNIIKKYT